MGKSIIISSQSRTYINSKIRQILQTFNLTLNSPDTLIVQREKKLSIGIEEINNLKIWSITKPYNSTHKLGLIYDAETLTEEAQNSMLKILEEPNPTMILILIVKSYRYLLATILSRCELILDTDDPLDQNTDFLKKSKLEQLIFIKKLVENRTKTKNNLQIQNFLTDLLYFYRANLLKGGNMDEYKFNITLIQETNKMLNANVLPKLALENLVINLK